MDHIFVSVEKFQELAAKIHDAVTNSETKYDEIICPLRGGFFLSYYMNKHTKLPIRYLEISSYKGKTQGEFWVGIQPELGDKKYILCDDIYDSGNTIKKIKEMYPDIHMDIACLLSKKPVTGYYVGEFVPEDCWVDFFWEKF